MSLPATVRVKLSSEAAESISITRVVVQDLAVRELVGHMLGITGKDAERIRDLLKRGTLVSGASRFRWTGWEADMAGIEQVLATFPDHDPTRPFAPQRCVRVILRGGRNAIEIHREAGTRKPFLRRTSFWDVLMEVAAAGEMSYLHYSYKDQADCYRRDWSPGDTEKLRAGHDLIKFSTLRDQVRLAGFSWAEFYVER